MLGQPAGYSCEEDMLMLLAFNELTRVALKGTPYLRGKVVSQNGECCEYGYDFLEIDGDM